MDELKRKALKQTVLLLNQNSQAATKRSTYLQKDLKELSTKIKDLKRENFDKVKTDFLVQKTPITRATNGNAMNGEARATTSMLAAIIIVLDLLVLRMQRLIKSLINTRRTKDQLSVRTDKGIMFYQGMKN